MYEQTATRLVRAPREAVYAALLDPRAVEAWRVPDDMSARVLEWEPRAGGRFRVALTYRSEGLAGKTGGASDVYTGRFVRLVPGEEVVEAITFEADDPAYGGEMRLTTTLREVPGGTEVELRHEQVPDAVSPEDNATGTAMALANLAAYAERTGQPD